MIGGMTSAAGFFILGSDMLAYWRQVGPSGIAVAILTIAFAIAGAGLVMTNVVILTRDGIDYRYNFRRKTIRWESVDSFGISPMPGIAPWSNLTVELRPFGKVRISGIVGPKRYVQQIITEFEAFQAQLQKPPSRDDHRRSKAP